VALLSTNRIAWEYHADDGTVYRVAAQKALTDQAVLGGAAAAGTVPQKPRGIKMRRATVSNASGHSRVVHVYETTAPIVTAGTSINVNYGSNSEAFTSNGGFIAEDSGKKNVTKQST
jgi:sRNA-binding protein